MGKTATTYRCSMCRGEHPTDGRKPGRVERLTVDGVEHTITKSVRYGNHWQFPHPDGHRALIILFSNITMDTLECGLRHQLEGPHPYEIDRPDCAWDRLSGAGSGICDGLTEAARVRHSRVLAAYRLTYAPQMGYWKNHYAQYNKVISDDLAAGFAQQRYESNRFRYSGPGDPHGSHHRARRYIAAYAAVLAAEELAGTDRPIFPIERHVIDRHVTVRVG